MEPFEQESDGRWERAVGGRLSKLRTLPVETGRLAAALHAQAPRPGRVARAGWLSLRSVRAVAASVLLAGVLAAALLVAAMSRQALASPAEMARMHDDLVSGRTPVMQVDSIEAANRMLAGEHPRFPALPDMPAEHIMACCMKSVANKNVGCVLLKQEGVPVSMMVARARDMRTPTSPVIVPGGVSYNVQSSGRLNMLMTERNGRWLCLIGETSAERLMDLASKLDF
jgi:hypothetical protein